MFFIVKWKELAKRRISMLSKLERHIVPNVIQ